MEHRLVTRSGHLATWLTAALLVLAVPLFCAILLAGDGTVPGRIAAGAGIVLSPLIGYWLTRGGFGPAPALLVDPGGLTIIHPRLLHDPVRIDRTNVRLARVCHGAPGLPFAANVQRFALSNGPGAAAEHRWAFDFKNGSLFSTLTAAAAAPTVLLVFREPVRLPVRRWLPRVLFRPGLRLPDHRPVAGLMLCVHRPAALESTVGTWGDPGPVDVLLAS